METNFNFKCPICGKTVRNTDVIRTMTGGAMCMRCYYNKRFFGKCEENAFDADFIKEFRKALEE